MSAAGRCLCGNIEYSLSQEVVSPDVCHCKNCQRQAGASFIPFVAVPLSELSVSGSPKTFMDTDTEWQRCGPSFLRRLWLANLRCGRGGA